MGTGEFGLPSLEKLVQSPFSVESVVTGPDRPKGRGLKLSPSPIKVFALEKGLNILQPERLRDTDFVSSLHRFKPDLFVVVAFRILPKEVFEIPPKGTINLHASLLPKYRGAAPIQWAIIKGEKRSGVTTFFIDEGIDTGNLILQREVDIEDDETAGQLHDRLAQIGADLLFETVEKIAQGKAMRMPQSDEEATPAPKLKKEDGRIDWSRDAEDIRNQIRGMNPFPGAYSEIHGRKVKIYKASLVVRNGREEMTPGEVVRIDDREGLTVSTGRGYLSLLEVQPEGKRRMNGPEFVRGYHPRVGDRFEAIDT